MGTIGSRRLVAITTPLRLRNLFVIGFRKLEIDRRRLTQSKRTWIECVPKVPYPVPQKSEPPDYYDDPDIQMLGEPSSDVL